MEFQYNVNVFSLSKNLKLNTEKWEKIYTKITDKMYIL
jgi:hypothetical protein